MKYRFLSPQVDTQAAPGTTRSIVGWVVLAVFMLVLVASVARWATGGPQEPPRAAQGIVGQPPVAIPDYYQCGAGFELYRVQLSDADRAVIEGMVEGNIHLPWKVVGCDGLTDAEIARRNAQGGQP